MRSRAQIQAVVESAFAPLRTVVEFDDERKTFGFRVHGPDNEPVITFEDQPVQSMRFGPGLELMIAVIRKGVERKGFTLFPRSSNGP